MKYTVCTFLLASLLCSAKTVHGRIYHTSDAIIVDAEDFSDGRNVPSRDSNVDARSLPFPELLATSDVKGSAIRVLPGGTFLMTSQTCWTPDGKFGTCSSVRSCYPNLKLASANDLDSLILSVRGTCIMAEPDGKQIYGVCCPSKQAQAPPFFIGAGANPGFPFGIMPGFPMWPSYFPVMPSPVSSVPALPPPTTTTAKPSTTSPWWVPESTTTSRPSTTSPWWVPESTTSRPGTTSPWWVPESTSTSRPSTWWVPDQPSSTTSRPSTTSPSWISEQPSTTTSRPSTTSPWWVPEATKPSTTKPSTTKPTTKPSTTKPTTKPSTTLRPAPVAVEGPETIPNESKFACGAGPYKTLSIDEQKRIVGGTNAVKNSWRFVVALFNKGRHFCGGSLIDSEHILTAAHCVAHMSSVDVSRLEVALGMHTLKPFDQNALRKRVRRVVRHKGYNAATLYNDVAILTLDSPVRYSTAISPVCLTPSGTNDLYAKREAVVVGWGALKEGGRQPEILQQVTVQIQTNAECKKNYGNDAPGGIAEHMICAAYPGKDSCSGDSGGPMVVQATSGAPWMQVGIVSWGIGCGKAPYPGVYSRVTSFMDWITKNTQ